MNGIDKISLFSVGPDDSIKVRTTLSNSLGAEIAVCGRPLIEIRNDFIQLGCIRITQDALLKLTKYAMSGRTGVIQDGNYETNDPNTRPRDRMPETATTPWQKAVHSHAKRIMTNEKI